MLEIILELLNNGKNVFLSGGAGTGKSYFSKEIIKTFKSEGKNVIALGSTGISAVNIGGLTTHSFFRFGLCASAFELAAHDKRQKAALNEVYKIISKIDLLVLDEISMISADLLEMIALRLKIGEFKGALLFVGDFYQLAPIRNEKSAATQNSLFTGFYAFESMAWGEFDFTNIMLTSSKRTANLEFYKMLELMRRGVCDNNTINFIKSRIFKNLPGNITWLFGINAKVNAMNAAALAALEGQSALINAEIKISDEKMSESAFNRWISSISLPQVLELKIGCEVMFCANKRGVYYNGERGVVREIKDDAIIVAKKDESVVELEKISFELNEFIEEDGEILALPRASFTQFPLRLAYAISIHKSQGMSLENFVCDINDIFAPGQLYVALSRAISPSGLFLRYNGGNLGFHIAKSLMVHKSVDDFYNNSSFIKE